MAHALEKRWEQLVAYSTDAPAHTHHLQMMMTLMTSSCMIKKKPAAAAAVAVVRSRVEKSGLMEEKQQQYPQQQGYGHAPAATASLQNPSKLDLLCSAVCVV